MDIWKILMKIKLYCIIFFSNKFSFIKNNLLKELRLMIFMGNNISLTGSSNKRIDYYRAIDNNKHDDLFNKLKPKNIEPIVVGNGYYVEITETDIIESIYYLPEGVKIGERYSIMNLTKNHVDVRGNNVKINNDILPYVLKPEQFVLIIMTSKGWITC